ncbi:deoxynucleoside kinase [Mycoplasmoides genitalium]|uniref:Uncharacterized protein MG268 n=2 Tax=Mycoplasmoides genitalium TaxID=2097 RepID=Y268_MYCGE|nr:deoxynucleoside kinase [Mycoplasmoides genitalium]P47510.1 RecName: Full=Uncharacterized protein MG268 [Mycoplasmoides genitalium G37]ABY79273.1 conserved hypothetical protein [synthetic Mycoplasma genitalium JCVI-1.0]AAC71490.1 conserved hypothetical protein [Mycoplasmoides genitalium G37]AFQ03101.1 deoxyguanosine kinase [Mycoplasmoides genitalium M2321]AFQ04093.1 deoxyguanosine kinase [Mycoplasmoides genitalium M6320]
MQLKKPHFQPNKIANCIVIGGMIALGKTTIANTLANHIQAAKVVCELETNDQLVELLLAKMYERSDELLYSPLFQLYFTLNRFGKYQNNCNTINPTIFDRSIFEDWLFAKHNIIRPAVFSYYNQLWNRLAKELVNKHGVPNLYVILDGDWKLFEKRLFMRNRKVEIDNFTKNQLYFQNLHRVYTGFMEAVCNDFGINYCIIDAKLPIVTIIKMILEKLKLQKLDWKFI